jgi:membrane protein DedA with SNARE-associated domain
VTSVLDSILGAPAWAVLGIIALVVFAEDALFVGFVLPGETVAILGGVAANRGHVALSAVLAVVVVAAIVGDSVGYEVGRHVGPRILRLRLLRRRQRRLDDAQDFLARRGGSAVFLGRWVAFFRAVMPALAGTARMPYPRFLAFNAAGGLVWGVAVVLAGYFAGASYAKVEKVLGRGAALVVLAVVLVAVFVWRVRAHRAEKEQSSGGARQERADGRGRRRDA